MTESMSGDRADIEELVEFWDEHPTIISQLPLEFPNGAKLETYRGRCKVCDQPIEANMLHGVIKQPTSKVYTIEAAGICVPCRTITDFNHRVRDDLSLEWIDENGRWVNRKPRAGLKTRIFKLLGIGQGKEQ